MKKQFAYRLNQQPLLPGASLPSPGRPRIPPQILWPESRLQLNPIGVNLDHKSILEKIQIIQIPRITLRANWCRRQRTQQPVGPVFRWGLVRATRRYFGRRRTPCGRKDIWYTRMFPAEIHYCQEQNKFEFYPLLCLRPAVWLQAHSPPAQPYPLSLLGARTQLQHGQVRLNAIFLWIYF